MTLLAALLAGGQISGQITGVPSYIVVAAPEPPAPVLGPVGVDLDTVPPPSIPDEIRAMMDAAMQSGDESGIDTIVKYARVADPGSGDLVLRRATEWREARARERNQRVRSASAWRRSTYPERGGARWTFLRMSSARGRANGGSRTSIANTI